ncbi:hypothetical protein SpiGrapes_0952 [Sphaerochaeta pleomorpha str. Grapes]|uniref:DUF1343 domain-containing protein n=1 Tax=Sphaerochaeta pleomorpha (strain ATCC BAA-1885 / DSM 22778 / Grapes) TaxID=158190 RepID=G8QRC5_SPHPG|nr:DUF1343 domain-containing protein [Sphaerochaeta pleomorpha]AEV28778.1 hypothetical protein SpiGrapes_0952 [Sphaerochaeta pleomorpha str. Grapes]
MIQFGLDRIGDYSSLLNHKRLALVTNNSAMNTSFVSSFSVVRTQYDLVALFGAEHGIRGEIGAGSCIDEDAEFVDGIPLFSLYRKDGQHLTEHMVSGIDAILFDIQDLGLRFYTYIATLKNLIEDCAHFGKDLIVLDRPNPLGGVVVEGNRLAPEFFSFVGPYSLPVRYGLTIGELALLLNAELQYGCKLTIIPMNGWKRSDLFDSLGLPWIMTSPAIGHFESALLYAGMCLFEGTNLSEGRGTSCPFELIGSPFLHAEPLCRAANELHLKGIVFTPAYFTPTASKYQGETCKGLYAHVLDKEAFRPVESALRLIQLIARLYSEDFAFLPPLAPTQRSPFENLMGLTSQDVVTTNIEILLNQCSEQSSVFAKEKEIYHLYR